MTEYTPTDALAKELAAGFGADESGRRVLLDAEFAAVRVLDSDWLRAHDAEVAANALRKAGRILEAEVLIGGDAHVPVSEVTASLNKRADRIEREAADRKSSPDRGSFGSEGSER